MAGSSSVTWTVSRKDGESTSRSIDVPKSDDRPRSEWLEWVTAKSMTMSVHQYNLLTVTILYSVTRSRRSRLWAGAWKAR